MKKACVIGWPIKHSRSPLIHGFWLKKYGISGSYEKMSVTPEKLNGFLHGLAKNGFCGCNVTIPHKEEAFKFVEVTDRVTTEIGAINTVFLENGKVFGLNTDGYGFLSNLKTVAKWDSRNKVSVIIGAGGAARAIIATLINDGIKTIYLANRTFDRAQKLAQEFGTAVKAKPFEELENTLNQTDLLINATSLGMTGQPALNISLENLPAKSLVIDIVYDPLETDLLKQAKANGNLAIDGLGMLLHQAVPGFEKWFGIRPKVTSELRELIVTDLQKDQSR